MEWQGTNPQGKQQWNIYNVSHASLWTLPPPLVTEGPPVSAAARLRRGWASEWPLFGTEKWEKRNTKKKCKVMRLTHNGSFLASGKKKCSEWITLRSVKNVSSVKTKLKPRFGDKKEFWKSCLLLNNFQRVHSWMGEKKWQNKSKRNSSGRGSQGNNGCSRENESLNMVLVGNLFFPLRVTL